MWNTESGFKGLLEVIYSNSFTMKGHAQPVPVSHHPCCTDLFLIYNLNLPSSSLKSFLSPQILLKIVPFFPGAPLLVLKGHYQVTSEISPGWTAPALSAYSHSIGVPPLWSFLWPFSGQAPRGLCLSFTVDSTSGHSTPGETSPTQSRGAGSLHSTCWPGFFQCRQGYVWL